jgi:hypothetical protein
VWTGHRSARGHCKRLENRTAGVGVAHLTHTHKQCLKIEKAGFKIKIYFGMFQIQIYHPPAKYHSAHWFLLYELP